MSADGVVITGGGSYAVASDDQLDRVQKLEAFAETAHTIVAQLVAINDQLTEGELTSAGAPASAIVAKRELAAAITSTGHAAFLAALTAKLTRAAMLAYGMAENAVVRTVDDWVGAFARAVGHAAGPGLLLVDADLILGMGLISPSTKPPTDPAGWQKFFADHPGLLNNPATAGMVKFLADGMDDSMLAAMGIPDDAIAMLKATGLTGPPLAAAVLMVLGYPFGKLRESSVKLAASKTVTGHGSAPTGWEDRVARIPDTAHNGGYQIRIDRFVGSDGKPSFEVYLSGTQTFSTSRTNTPFDFSSDNNGSAKLPNGALASVEKAMREAGIRPGDPVNLTGHSEGGLVAHEVAATGHWNVQVTLEAGAPVSHSAVPSSTTEIAMQHNEDIVPSLGGIHDPSDKAVVVHTTAFPGGDIPTGESSPPAHDTDRYQHTAKLLDHASSSLITDAKEKANSAEKGASTTVTTTYYKAERVWKK